MSEDVMRKHIDLYVNNFSIDLGDDGKAAVQKLLNIHQIINKNKLPSFNKIFLGSGQP